MKTGAIVLAAGRSRRFGGDKRKALLPNGRMVIEQTIESILPHFEHILVVLRDDDQALADDLQTLSKDSALRTYLSPQSDQGMGHNLANAIQQVTDWEGAFVFLADMPYLTGETITQLKLRLRPDNCVVPLYDNRRGHPVGFGKNFFSEIANLVGDQGAKPIMTAHPNSIIQVAVDDDGVLRDIDTPRDIDTA